jgi:hypothetical protein
MIMVPRPAHGFCAATGRRDASQVRRTQRTLAGPGGFGVFFLWLIVLWSPPTTLHAQDAWLAVSSPTTSALWGATYGNGLFVAVGDHGTIITSPDGTQWTPRNSTTTQWLLSVSYGGGTFVAVGNTGSVLTSPDGLNWATANPATSQGTPVRLNVAYHIYESFAAVGESGSYATQIAKDLPLGVGRDAFAPLWRRGMAFGHGLLVVAGEEGIRATPYSSLLSTISALLRSDSALYRTEAGIRSLEGVHFANDRFVAVGEDGVIVVSLDGKVWSAVSSGTASHFFAVGRFNNLWVATGASGQIRTSDNGLAWTARNSPTSTNLRAIATSPNVAILVGDGGTLVKNNAAARTPTVLTPPASQTADAGGGVVFEAEVAGSAPLSFQWSFNGSPLPGATERRLALNHLSPTHAGSYSVTVSNASGSVVSNPASLAVTPGTTPIVDPGFDATASLTGAPTAILPLDSGGVLVAGGTPGRIVRLLASGALDSSFKPIAAEGVTRLHVDGFGQIFFGGMIPTLSSEPRWRLFRARPDGTPDLSFFPAAGTAQSPVTDFAFQDDGKVIVANGTNSITRFLRDGSVDPSFPQIAPPRYTSGWRLLRVVIAASGEIFVAGTLNPGLSSGSSFVFRYPVENPLAAPVEWAASGGNLSAFRQIDNGDLALATYAYKTGIGSSFSRNLKRFTPAGQVVLETNFPTLRGDQFAFSIGWTAAHLYPDGRALLASDFTSFDGYPSNGLARVTATGNLDLSFNAGQTPVERVTTLAVGPQGKIYAGGAFTFFNGTPRAWLVRLNEVASEGSKPPQVAALTSTASSVKAGTPITLRAAVSGSGALTYRWYRGPGTGDLIATTIEPEYTFVPPFSGYPGGGEVELYSVRAINALGVSSSHQVAVNVLPADPVILQQSTRMSAASGRNASLGVTINTATVGRYLLTWRLNGNIIPSANSLSLRLPAVSASSAGTYTLTVRNASGIETVSAPIVLSVDDSARFTNLSTRVTLVSDTEPTIAGFVIAGSSSRTLLIRGLGPALSKFGVAGVVADPKITLFNSANQFIRSNDNWAESLTIADFNAVGAFLPDPGSKDAAILISGLEPGSYTAHLTGGTGAGMIEIYESDNEADRMINLSTRTYVSATAGATISGIAIRGPVAKTVLFRAIGPGLRPFGLTNVLANPSLAVVDERGRTVASNDDWSSNAGGADLLAAFSAVGAFSLTPGSTDAAVVVTLPPGNYTTQILGSAGTSGVALVEVYELPLR